MTLQRLIDFQIFAEPLSEGDVLRVVNEALFVVQEPLRLWILERRLTAPFKKLVVSLRDETVAARWHGHVGVASGVCMVTETVAVEALRERVRDHRWVLGVVTHALDSIEQHGGWTSDELRARVQHLHEKELPLVHGFADLTRSDGATGLTCEPWLETSPGCTQVGLRFVARGSLVREVVVLSKSGPLLLEIDFPFTKTLIRGSSFVFLDKNGKALATVPLPHA